MTNNNPALDRLLRQKLTEATPPPASPEGWERLSSALDADADLHLRDALTGLAAADDATGWAALEHKLDPLAATNARLAAALNELTPEPTPDSWAVLSARLDDEIGSEVDAVVAPQLVREAGAVSGWPALAARLELIAHRRSLVAAWKITEVCLLTSMVLLLLRFGPGERYENDILAALNGGFPMANTAEETPESVVADVPEKTPASAPGSARTTANKIATDREQPLTLTAVAPTGEDIAPAIVPVPVNVTVARLSGPNYTVTELAPGTENDEPTAIIAGPRHVAKWSGTLPSPALQLPAIDKTIPVRYYLNLFASPTELNQVITKQSDVGSSRLAGRKELTHSVSAGALLDITKGKDGLQIGAVYSRHAYIPAELTLGNCFVEDNCSEGYNEFIYHSISFPFSYERSLLERNGWRLASRAGMAMSIITRSDFRLTPGEGQEDLEAALLNGGPRGGPPRMPSSITIPVNNVVDPEAGWFEGGSILVNASFYLEGGFSVERAMTPRWSLYVTPTYGRVINLREEGGVGPYNDKIHRASLRFGSRFLLSGK